MFTQTQTHAHTHIYRYKGERTTPYKQVLCGYFLGVPDNEGSEVSESEEEEVTDANGVWSEMRKRKRRSEYRSGDMFSGVS